MMDPLARDSKLRSDVFVLAPGADGRHDGRASAVVGVLTANDRPLERLAPNHLEKRISDSSINCFGCDHHDTSPLAVRCISYCRQSRPQRRCTSATSPAP